MALVLSNSASKLLEPGITVLQLLLGIRTQRGFLKLLNVGSHEGPSKGRARSCESGSGLACVSPLGSVLLLNDGGDMAVVVVLVSLQAAKDASSPALFSCVQATLGVAGKERAVKQLDSTYSSAINCFRCANDNTCMLISTQKYDMII